MEIIVCLKRVPDTFARIEIKGLGIKEEGLDWVLNPFDEFAVEEALLLRERFAGRVTVITAGPEGGEEILKKAVAMGADEAVYVKDRKLRGVNGHGIARVLARAIFRRNFDLVICGKQGTDMDAGYVGGAIAGLLDIPLVSAIKKLRIEERRLEANREVEGGVETVESTLPALLTAQKGLNEPRYPTLPGIMRAKKQEIIFMGLDPLGINPVELENPLKRVALDYPSVERKGRILKGDIHESIREVAVFLKGFVQ